MYQINFPPLSNRASWVFLGTLSDLDDNLIDLSLCSMVFQIRPPSRDGAPYPTSYDSYPGDYAARGSLIASTDNGKLTIVGMGTFRWFFTLQDMRSLCPGTYDTGLTLTNDDGTQTIQLSVGPLAIVDGVVP